MTGASPNPAESLMQTIPSTSYHYDPQSQASSAGESPSRSSNPASPHFLQYDSNGSAFLFDDNGHRVDLNDVMPIVDNGVEIPVEQLLLGNGNLEVMGLQNNPSFTDLVRYEPDSRPRESIDFIKCNST